MIDKIFNEDCIETMQRLEANKQYVDIILTSPPYHIRTDTFFSGSTQRYDSFQDKSMTDDEYINWSLNIFKHFETILNKDGVILYNLSYGNKSAVMYLVLAEIIKNTAFTIIDKIAWLKGNCLPVNTSPNKLSRITEDIYVICRKNEIATFKANGAITNNPGDKTQNRYTVKYNFIKARNNDGVNDLNKATFSTELVLKLLNMYAYSKDLIVYDPFMGTGTTANGCVQFGCHYIGSELSEKQCEYAENRLSKAKEMSMNDW